LTNETTTRPLPKTSNPLHAAFLIDAQNDRVGRRIHVQPNDITQLFDKFRIVAELEVLHAVRLQVVGAQDRLNRRATDANLSARSRELQ